MHKHRSIVGPATGRPHPERGIALAGVLIFTVISAFFSAAVLHALSVHSRLVQDKYNYTRALYLAESGLNRAAEAVWTGYLNANPLPDARIAWLEDHYTDFDQEDVSIGPDGDTYTVKARRMMTTGDDEERLIVFEAIGNAVGGIEPAERTITRVIRYGHDQGSIFDYTYFLNNFGWFYGSSITANGEVRGNGNFEFQSSPTVNGDVYASINPDVGAGAPGQILGSYNSWNLSTYRTKAVGKPTWRPTRPEFEYGYSGESTDFEFQQILEMPYLGDISRFEALAQQKNGELTTTASSGPAMPTHIDNVIQGPLFLYGTPTNPIVIDGPVVVRGDVAIAGYVTGQGTIYSDRNIHVVNDVIYKTPPIYDKSAGADPNANAAYNQAADFLGLAAKGNIILGDYTSTDWTGNVAPYIKPPFTKSYTDEDGTRHNGDYTASDGAKSDGTVRKRYEGTWTNAQFQSMVNLAKSLYSRSDSLPRRIDALGYTNHLYAGRAKDAVWNGAIMSRDEGIVFNGSVTMNYDYRAKQEGEQYIDIDLPKAANAEPTIWLEGPYEQWVSKLDPLDHSLQD
ncbi:MAG: hypothetical protein KJ050_01265 [Candidatus Omnitrophica bacterium]|nr:hypothetical protein [Candidatus Omnitrophota bacterium]